MLEVFASIQGEGLHVGRPQVFVRLAGCPLRCRYCDTPGSWELSDEPRGVLRRSRADGGPRRLEGWSSALDVAAWIVELDPDATTAVSLTGGEPLVWPDFAGRLADLIQPRDLHLETAGHDPAALAEVLPHVAHVSLDLKEPGDLDAPQAFALTAELEEHGPRVPADLPASEAQWESVRRDVLRLARPAQDCAKLVLVGGRPASAYVALLEDVSDFAPELPVVLQPATPLRDAPAPSQELIDEVLRAAQARELDVRVLPQVHRALGMP